MTTVTVPELKAEAKSLGIVGYSAMRKPELLAAIDAKRAESDPDKIDTPTPSATPAKPLTRAQRASQAGANSDHAQPMSNAERASHYHTQHSLRQGRMCVDVPPTPAQVRRMRKKGNKLSGFNGCTLAQYREVKRRMKSAGMIPAGQR